MFVVRRVTVEIGWRRGGVDTDLGTVEYPAGESSDFLALDSAISNVLPVDEGTPSGAAQAQHRLEQASGLAVEQPAEQQPAGRQRPAPQPQPQPQPRSRPAPGRG